MQARRIATLTSQRAAPEAENEKAIATLKGAEAELVRKELEENVAQGLDTRSMSPWGSWAFPTKEALGAAAAGPSSITAS